MAKTSRKAKSAPGVQPLAWDIDHPGARQIWCAALAGICANPALISVAAQANKPSATLAVDFANEVMEQVIKRTENQHATERPMAKENPK